MAKNKKIIPQKLSDIKFDKKGVIKGKKFKKMITDLDKTIADIDKKREVDWDKLHRPMDI